MSSNIWAPASWVLLQSVFRFATYMYPFLHPVRSRVCFSQLLRVWYMRSCVLHTTGFDIGDDIYVWRHQRHDNSPMSSAEPTSSPSHTHPCSWRDCPLEHKTVCSHCIRTQWRTSIYVLCTIVSVRLFDTHSLSSENIFWFSRCPWGFCFCGHILKTLDRETS